jgi:hypothetical protein
VDHLAALRLDEAAHDVDGGVVAVEQRGGRDEAQRCVGGGAVFHADVGGRSAHGSFRVRWTAYFTPYSRPGGPGSHSLRSLSETTMWRLIAAGSFRPGAPLH